MGLGVLGDLGESMANHGCHQWNNKTWAMGVNIWGVQEALEIDCFDLGLTVLHLRSSYLIIKEELPNQYLWDK